MTNQTNGRQTKMTGNYQIEVHHSVYQNEAIQKGRYPFKLGIKPGEMLLDAGVSESESESIRD